MTAFSSKTAVRGLTAATALALLVAACGGDDEEPTAGDDEGTVTVTIQEWVSLADTPMEEVIAAFEEQNPDIKVEIAPVIPFGDEYDTRMQTQFGAGTAPSIFRMNDDLLGGFSREGVLKDLSPYLEDVDESQYLEPLYEFGLQEDGSYTGFAVGTSPRAIFYNVDMFEEAGVELPPTEYTDEGWTWEDFLEAAEALTIPGERWGAAVVQDAGYENTWAMNNGSETGVFSADGMTFTLAEPVAAEGLQFAADLSCVHEVQPPWSTLQQDHAAHGLFGTGKLGMLHTIFAENAEIQDLVTDFEYDIAPVPGNANQVNENSLYVYIIPESTPQSEADAAWKLLEFMASEEGGTILGTGSYFVPINRAGAEAIQTQEGVPPGNMGLLMQASENGIVPNFPPQNASLAKQLYRPQLETAYTCERSVQDVVSDIEGQVNEALNEG